ncbi:WIYLD domain-containing protein [Cynara cardunculus var. scolymus]|uniref:WIYLD domain-containing protein n=1 Tax=Cynara cardunculus var. scolymus TaxID=59895 RepID=A0A103YIU6_CYNCS|nr:WIYLD domain-containing protein [Cynara cardunculus var. scolymus]
MDAAIDAMAPFGFTEEVVVAKMRELLKEYGGQNGYGFIELDAYTVLLEALLADQEKGNCEGQNQEQIPYGKTSKANELVEGEKVEGEEGHEISPADISVCSSSRLTIPPPPQPQPQPPILDAVLPLPPLPPSPPVTDAALPPPENAQPRRRKPCHGWISDDNEEWHLIRLPSSINQAISLPETPPTQPGLTGARKNRTRRRSRWDLRPEDM